MKSRGYIAISHGEKALSVIREYGVNSDGTVGFNNPQAALKDAVSGGHNKSSMTVVQILTRSVPRKELKEKQTFLATKDISKLKLAAEWFSENETMGTRVVVRKIAGRKVSTKFNDMFDDLGFEFDAPETSEFRQLTRSLMVLMFIESNRKRNKR